MTREGLLVLILIAYIVYFPLNRRRVRYYWKLPIDDLFPLIPAFIIPYAGYFYYILFTLIVLWDSAYIYALLFAILLSYSLACCVWYLLPNGVKRPHFNGESVFKPILKFLYRNDKDGNGFPSAHVFVTLICTYYLSLAFSSYLPLFLAVASFIVISTLFVKQHYIIDVLGGVLVFVISAILV